MDSKAIDASSYEDVLAKKAEAQKRAKDAQDEVKTYDDLLAELKKSETSAQG